MNQVRQTHTPKMTSSLQSTQQTMESQGTVEFYSNVSRACQEFSLHLHKALSSASEENVVTSPLSAHIIASLVAQGAKGKTLKEMEEGLQLHRYAPALEEFNFLLNVFNKVQGVELNLANALYINKSFELLPEFMEISQHIYDCVVSKVDYQQPIHAAKTINEWVVQQTKDKIKDAVSPDDIEPLTRLVLVNAIYFKGNWLEQFDFKLTKDEKFYTTESNFKLVPTMIKKWKYPHGDLEDWDAKFLEIPYVNKEFSMIIVLPNKIDGLRSLEEKFSWDVLRSAETSSNNVELHFPKFKIEARIDLKKSFQMLGMKQMFTRDADFSALAERALSVDKAFQKLYIQVDEEGSEAAAATVVTMTLRSVPMPPEIFRVNHPFMIAIRHKPSGVPLFFGSVRNIP